MGKRENHHDWCKANKEVVTVPYKHRSCQTLRRRRTLIQGMVIFLDRYQTENFHKLDYNCVYDVRKPSCIACDERRVSLKARLEVAHEGHPSGAAPKGQHHVVTLLHIKIRIPQTSRVEPANREIFVVESLVAFLACLQRATF